MITGELKMYTPVERHLGFFPLLYFSHVVAHLKGREMFLLGSGTGFPFMSVFDIRDMLRP